MIGVVDMLPTFSETAGIQGFAPESVYMDRLGIVSGKSFCLMSKYREYGITIRDGGWGIDYPNCLQGDDPVDVMNELEKLRCVWRQRH